MAMYENRPNIVNDDNYKMFVSELTRRYATRGASLYSNAEAMDQDRREARARAAAPDAYRLSRGAASVSSFRTGCEGGVKYMTVDDYLSYFSKCHDAFDAIHYLDMHTEKQDDVKAKVVINRRKVDEIEKLRNVVTVRKQKKTRTGILAGFSAAGRRAFAGLAAAALSVTLFVGGLFIYSGVNEEVASNDVAPTEEIVEVANNY